MTSLPLSQLVQVVELLPTPVAVTDGDGMIVGLSSPAAEILELPAHATDAHLGHQVASLANRPATIERTSIVAESGAYELVTFGEAPPPKDVAALAGAVAHDFNNLLGVIINFTTLAAATVPAGSAAAADLREVLAAAERAAVITHRLQELGDVRGAGRFVEPR